MGIAGDFVLIVLAGLAGAVIARLLGAPLLVGYVAAGVAVGPYTAGPTVTQVEDIELLAEIGVALLLFALGLEVSLRDLAPVRRIAVIGGPIQIVLCALLGGWVAMAVAGLSMPEATWFGAMASLSSTMVVLKILAATDTTTTLASRVMIGLLVIQDLAVVPMLVVLPQIGGASVWSDVAKATVLAGLFLVGVFILGTRALPALLRHVLRWGSRELFLVAVVAVGVGVGALAHQLGLSFAIGAFMAGLVLSESELSHQALADVAPLRDVFGLLFFVSVGMLFDPRYAFSHLSEVVTIVSALAIGKALICGTMARLFGYRHLAPWVVGLGLSQVGEFSFVLARTARAGEFIGADTYSLALTCTVLSMAVSPAIFPGLLPVARAWLRRRGRTTADNAAALRPRVNLENHVIVAGYGRTGRAVTTALERSGDSCVVVDHHPDTVTWAQEQSVHAVLGNVAAEEVLRAAGITDARMLVLAVSEWQALRLAIAHARRINPRVVVVARAPTITHVEELRQLRVDVVVQPEVEAGIAMIRRVLAQRECSDEEIQRLSREVRHALYGDGT